MSSPFDTLAAQYDFEFSASRVARYLRGRVHERLDTHFRRGDHVLELGCGTGEDALYLASQGIRVTATDSSTAMLEIARAKTAHQPLITVQPLDLRNLTDDFPVVDGVFANFGVINCLSDWQPLAAWLADRLAPDGVAAFGVMSPLCAWEMAWHGIHGDFDTAFRRLRSDVEFRPTPESAIPVAYPAIRTISRDFAPYFQKAHVEPLGLTLPTSDGYAGLERHSTILNALTGLDQRLSRFSLLASFADHYWIEFERAS